jgi:hypothetical protein
LIGHGVSAAKEVRQSSGDRMHLSVPLMKTSLEFISYPPIISTRMG